MSTTSSTLFHACYTTFFCCPMLFFGAFCFFLFCFYFGWSLCFVLTSYWHSADEMEPVPPRPGQRMLVRETFDLSQPAPLTRMHTTVVAESTQSQLPLPHTPRIDKNEPQGDELCISHSSYMSHLVCLQIEHNVFQEELWCLDSLTCSVVCMQQKHRNYQDLRHGISLKSLLLWPTLTNQIPGDLPGLYH